MARTHVAVATITLARGSEERSLLLSGLRALAALSIPVFATDGGSDAAFLEEACQIAGVTFCEPARGLWPQARRSLEAARALGAQWLLYTEPDKVDFFRERLPAFIESAPANQGIGVVLVARDAGKLATFPAFQQYTESVINRCCAEVIGPSFDYSYGPFLLASSVVPHIIVPTEDVGWGWRPFTFGIAHRLGLRVEQAFAASNCPPGQRGDAERVYRMRQLAQSLEGLVLSTNVPVSLQGVGLAPFSPRE
jgi:hypothetical protein